MNASPGDVPSSRDPFNTPVSDEQVLLKIFNNWFSEPWLGIYNTHNQPLEEKWGRGLRECCRLIGWPCWWMCSSCLRTEREGRGFSSPGYPVSAGSPASHAGFWELTWARVRYSHEVMIIKHTITDNNEIHKTINDTIAMMNWLQKQLLLTKENHYNYW